MRWPGGGQAKLAERQPAILSERVPRMAKKRRKRGAPKAAPKAATADERGNVGAERTYRRACRLAAAGQTERARAVYREVLQTGGLSASLSALVENDLGALAMASGDQQQAVQRFRAALALDSTCKPAQANLEFCGTEAEEPPRAAKAEPARESAAARGAEPTSTRVAIVSMLFNWPSSGGGIMHTVGLGRALIEAGYEVRHFWAEHRGRGIGRVDGETPLRGEAVVLDDASWNVPAIQSRFRDAVGAFAPDHVVVTDSWSFKPHLAQAVQDYRYVLRFDSQECLCPLNNCRFLMEPGRGFRQCPHHQLATPEECLRCLREQGRRTSQLHRDERELSGVGTEGYLSVLRGALEKAEAVLVNNPLIEAMISPYAPRVRVVPPGVDPRRFPADAVQKDSAGDHAIVFMAGVIEEPFKGFQVLHEACALLRRKRQDFQLVVTGKQAGRIDDFTRSVGWLSQDELPRHYAAADICVVPSLVQDAWATVTTEAMAAGRPIVASRVGGMQFQVVDGATGLLAEPGNAGELAEKIEHLLDHPELRSGMGAAGRERFENRYAWPVIIERHYRPLFSEPRRQEAAAGAASEVRV